MTQLTRRTAKHCGHKVEMKDISYRRAKVLVADDDGYLLALIARVLEAEGYIVQTAHNGAETLDQAREDPPDLILLDLRMPVMDGSTCCRALKLLGETVNVPVILMSGDSVAADTRANLGAAHFLSKPFEVSDLLLCIKTHISSPEP